MLSVGDTVRPVDDLQRRGTVLKISTEPRRHNGFPQFDLPRMVYVEWDKTPSHWEPPELLSKVQ
jgi:hypothetical protein